MKSTRPRRFSAISRVGQTEIGAAWKKTSREDRAYLAVKLDDPSFPAPIYASLVSAGDSHSLIWSRSRSD